MDVVVGERLRARPPPPPLPPSARSHGDLHDEHRGRRGEAGQQRQPQDGVHAARAVVVRLGRVRAWISMDRNLST